MSLLRSWLAAWWSRRLPAQTHVRLGQKHIFIVPTLAGYAFAAALALMLMVAINYQNSLAYALTFLLASVGLLSILHTWRNLAGLQLVGVPAEACFAGTNARFPLRLQASRRPYQAIGLGWPRQELVLADVAKHSESLVELSVAVNRRGKHRVGRIRVETRFPLGIWVAWSQVDLAQTVLVYPKPINAQLELTGVAVGEDVIQGVATTGRGVDDYQGLEAWQQGDSLRRINWKVWSKGQGLWVKHFAELKGAQVQLDFSSLSGDLEYRLSVLCAQVLQLTQQEIPFSLKLLEQRIGPSSGAAHQTECLTALALFAGGDNG